MKYMPFKDTPEGQAHAFHLAYCEKCVQMTNHYEYGDCLKCTITKATGLALEQYDETFKDLADK